MGTFYSENGEDKKAIECFDKAVQLNPDMWEAYSSRGAAFYHQEQYDKCIDDCNHALRLRPDDWTAMVNRGSSYFSKGDNKTALADYNAALRLQPGNAKLMVNIADVYRAMNQCKESVDICNQAITLDPNYFEAYLCRGAAYVQLGQAAKAIADADNVVRMQPRTARAYYIRGNAYYANGDFKSAATDYGNALKLEPHDSMALPWRAFCNIALKKPSAAVDDVSRWLKLTDWKNRDTAYLCALKYIAQRMNKEAEAADELKVALTKVPKDSFGAQLLTVMQGKMTAEKLLLDIDKQQPRDVMWARCIVGLNYLEQSKKKLAAEQFEIVKTTGIKTEPAYKFCELSQKELAG
jgi:tetratricopeptide (TPR) repeat protein